MALKSICFFMHLILTSLTSTIASDNKMWNPVAVSATVLYDPTLQNATHLAESDIVCSMMASRYFWANLFCFGGGSCFISSLQAVQRHPPYNVTSPVNCMTTLPFGCLHSNGTIIPNNAVYSTNACNKFLCNDGVIEQLEPLTCPLTLVKGYGCFKYVDTPATYATAFDSCLSFNCSQLATFPQVIDPTFIPFVASALNITKSFRVGFAGVLTPLRTWTWMTSKLPVTLNPAMWAPGYPSTGTPNSGIADSSNSFKYSQRGGPLLYSYGLTCVKYCNWELLEWQPYFIDKGVTNMRIRPVSLITKM